METTKTTTTTHKKQKTNDDIFELKTQRFLKTGVNQSNSPKLNLNVDNHQVKNVLSKMSDSVLKDDGTPINMKQSVVPSPPNLSWKVGYVNKLVKRHNNNNNNNNNSNNNNNQKNNSIKVSTKPSNHVSNHHRARKYTQGDVSAIVSPSGRVTLNVSKDNSDSEDVDIDTLLDEQEDD